MSALVVVSCGVFAADLFVADRKLDPNASDEPGAGRGTAALPYATIQAAVEAAEAAGSGYSFDAGDAIKVAEGLYNYGGHVDANGYTNRVYISKKVRIVATGAKENTILEGNVDPTSGNWGLAAVQGVYMKQNGAAGAISDARGSIFRGFTVRNCCTHKSGGKGGAFFVEDGPNAYNALYVADCIISNNTANLHGGLCGATVVRSFISNNHNVNGTLGTASRYTRYAHCVFYGSGTGNSGLTSDAVFVNCTAYDCATDLSGTRYNTIVMRCDGSATGAASSHNITYATRNDIHEVVSPATRDFRLLDTAAAVGAASYDNLSQVTYPEEFGQADFYGKPLPTTGPLHSGACQTVVKAATGELKIIKAAAVDGFPLFKNGAGTTYTYAFSDVAPRQFVVTPANALNAFYAGSSVYSTAPHPFYDGNYRLMAPEVGNVINFELAAQSAVLWVDDKDGDDSRDGKSEATALKTLAEAAKKVVGNTIIMVKPGVYDDGANGSARADFSAGGCGWAVVSLRSTEGPEKTVIVGGKNIQCLKTPGNIGVLGFTFTGYDGVGSVCELPQAQTFYQDCIFSNNIAKTVADKFVERCRFIGNRVTECVFKGAYAHGSLFAGNTCGSGTVFGDTTGIHNCTVVGNTTTGASLFGTCGIYNSVVMDGPGVGTGLTGGDGCYFWNLDSFANVPATATVAEPRLACPDNGDCRPLSDSQLRGGGAAYNAVPALNSNNFRVLATGGVDCDWLNFISGRHTVGAYQRSTVRGVRIDAGKGCFIVTGAHVGLNELSPGASLTFTLAPDPNATRYCQGFYADGEYVDFGDYPQGWTKTVGPNDGSCVLTPVYSTKWYVSPTGSDANNGFTTNTPFKTFAHAFTKVEDDDLVVAMPGVYDGESQEPQLHWDGATVPSRVVVPRDMTLAALDPDPANTVIEGEAATATTPAVRCVTLFPNARLRGFTLRNGRCNSSSSVGCDQYGAGVYGSASKLAVDGYNGLAEDCVITNCSVSRGGAAWRTYLRRCKVISCGTAVYESYVANTLFSGCGGGFAATMYCPLVANCTFDASNGDPFWVNSDIRNTLVLGKSQSIQNNTYCVFVNDKASKPAVADLGTGSVLTNTAALHLDANGSPTVESAPLLEKGTSSGYADWCGDTDLTGGQRVYNGGIDIGCHEFDWRPVYAADIRRVNVTSATKGVVETTDRNVRLGDGQSVTLVWKLGRPVPTKRVFPLVVSGGTLTVSVNGAVVATFAADGEWTYANGAASDVIGFSFAGADGFADLLSSKSGEGLLLLVR